MSEQPLSNRTVKERLARFMDPGAFTETVPDSVKHTCPEVGRLVHDKLKVRREIAMKRACAAIRFFLKPENLAHLNQRAASVDRSGEAGETREAGLDPKGESAVTAKPADAQPPSPQSDNKP